MLKGEIQFVLMEFPQELVDFINKQTKSNYTQGSIKEIVIRQDDITCYKNLLFDYSQEVQTV